MKPGSQIAVTICGKDGSELMRASFSVEDLINSVPGLLRDMRRAIKRGDLETAEALLSIADTCNEAATMATLTLRRYTDQIIRILPTFDWGEENDEVFRRYVEATKS